MAIKFAEMIRALSQCNCKTKSAFDKAKAKKPILKSSETFTVLSHPPDFGNEFNQLGNI
jgi:hypothetical protein